MERCDFARLINSIVVPEDLPVEEINARVQPVSRAIREMMPERLFRFRAFDNKSFGAFRDGIIYAVTADWFNDPYDTLARYDLEEIETGVNAVLSREALEQLQGWLKQGNDFPDYIKQNLPGGFTDALKERLLSIEDFTTMEDRIRESRHEMISLIETIFPVLSEMNKRFSAVACFCESVQPVLMWSHYADSHKGFALEYDFRTTLDHPLKNISLFPVIYGEERVDISVYIAWEFLFMMGLRTPNPDTLFSIKNALYKSSVWEYEREWRLIDSAARDITDNRPSAIPFEPVAIYYGRHMSREHKLQLHAVAQEKGIKEFEMFVDYSFPLYEMQYRPAEF